MNKPKTLKDKVSSKTLRRLTFQEVTKLREIADGIHNPYVYAKWIPEKDVKGLVVALQERLKQIDKRYANKRSQDMAKLNLLDEVLAKLGIREEKGETE